MHGLRLETENSLFLKPVNFGLSNFVKKLTVTFPSMCSRVKFCIDMS